MYVKYFIINNLKNHTDDLGLINVDGLSNYPPGDCRNRNALTD